MKNPVHPLAEVFDHLITDHTEKPTEKGMIAPFAL
jgi:hypothetical protein